MILLLSSTLNFQYFCMPIDLMTLMILYRTLMFINQLQCPDWWLMVQIQPAGLSASTHQSSISTIPQTVRILVNHLKIQVDPLMYQLQSAKRI